MIKFISTILLNCILLSAGSPVAAQTQFPDANWSRQEALETVAQTDNSIQLKQLFKLAREGNSNQLLGELEAIESSQTLPDPARDQIFHAFALGLGDLPAWSVEREILDHLYRYEPQTRVPHDSRASVGVALFNVRAAVSGSVSQWQRNSGWTEARRMLPQGSAAWLLAYLESGTSHRKGFLDALSWAPPGQLEELGELALRDISKDSSLSPVATTAAILLADPDLFQRAVATGKGAGLASTLRSARDVFDQAEIESILKYSMARAKPEIGSLAMAELAPTILSQPEVTQLLFDTLEHQELGVTAAMLLSSSTQPAVRQQLEKLAKSQRSLASKRASLAIAHSDLRAKEDER